MNFYLVSPQNNILCLPSFLHRCLIILINNFKLFSFLKAKFYQCVFLVSCAWKKQSCRLNSPSQFSSVAQLCPTLCDPMDRSTTGLPVHHQLLELVQAHVHRVSDAIQASHPLSSPSPPALNLSQHRVFSNESALRIRWPKYWSFSFNISPSNENPGLISFRMDWLDLLGVQENNPSNH